MMMMMYKGKFIFLQDLKEDCSDVMLKLSWLGEAPVVEDMERQVAREVRINNVMQRKSTIL